MRKKIVVLGMTAGLVASMGLVGCSNNSTVESQAGNVSTTVAQVVDVNNGATQSVEENVEIENSSEAEEVAQVVVATGVVTEITEEKVVIDMDGQPVEAMISEATEITEDIAVNDNVNVTYDGMMTRSIPAQMPNVISISKIEDVNEAGEVEVIDVEEDGSEEIDPELEAEAALTRVTTLGTITEINETEVYFENEAGVTIIALLSDSTETYEGMAVGDKILIEHADMMLMSEPGQLPEVYNINKTDAEESIEVAEVEAVEEAVETEEDVEVEEVEETTESKK